MSYERVKGLSFAPSLGPVKFRPTAHGGTQEPSTDEQLHIDIHLRMQNVTAVRIWSASMCRQVTRDDLPANGSRLMENKKVFWPQDFEGQIKRSC